MGKHTRRKRSLLRRTDGEVRAPAPSASTATRPPAPPREPVASAVRAPEPGPTLVPIDAPAAEPLDPPRAPDASDTSEASPVPEPVTVTDEPVPVVPGVVDPRFVPRERMMRGHVREPPPEPLLEDWEVHAVAGLFALATGFVLTGTTGLFAIWYLLGDEPFRAIFGP